MKITEGKNALLKCIIEKLCRHNSQPKDLPGN